MNQSIAKGYRSPKDQSPHNPSIDERMQGAVERLYSQADRLRSLADRLCGVEIEREKQGAQAGNVEPIRMRPVFQAIDTAIDAVHNIADSIATDCERIAGSANIPG